MSRTTPDTNAGLRRDMPVAPAPPPMSPIEGLTIAEFEALDVEDIPLPLPSPVEGVDAEQFERLANSNEGLAEPRQPVFADATPANTEDVPETQSASDRLSMLIVLLVALVGLAVMMYLAPR